MVGNFVASNLAYLAAKFDPGYTLSVCIKLLKVEQQRLVFEALFDNNEHCLDNLRSLEKLDIFPDPIAQNFKKFQDSRLKQFVYFFYELPAKIQAYSRNLLCKNDVCIMQATYIASDIDIC